MKRVPAARIRSVNPAPPRPGADFVLYWCVAARRPRWNFALARAAEWCEETGKPLVVLEALRAGHQYASPRLHRFVLDGMADQAAYYAGGAVAYYPYAEPRDGDGKGLLESFAAQAVVVVTDDAPFYFLPRMVEAAGLRLGVRLEAVDGNGLLPLRAAGRDFATAFAFRRFVQRELPHHFENSPEAEPARRLTGARAVIPATIASRWPPASAALLGGDAAALAALVAGPAGVVETRGGFRAAGERLERFVDQRLDRYADDHSHPDRAATSGLSPYLHFGHLSAHEAFASVARHEDWSPGRIEARATAGKATAPSGKRTGWWRMRPAAEAFLDQLVTWRELGHHTAAYLPGFDRYETLPEWALRTLARHAGDPRPHAYDVDTLERAGTHDPLWNAAQRQLLRDGVIHNYLRMLWGKKILEWSPSPQEALRRLLELNDRYALDGRDPNSVSGIFWTLGRYDRAWGPERPIFGTVRYMSSENSARKLRLREYIARYGA